MRIRALLILATTLLGVMALSGAALAATKTCSVNPCVGTKGADRLKGNATKNEIRGLHGADYIAGKQRADDLYGNRARTRCVPATAETACSAGGAGTSSTAAAETTR